MNRYELRQAKFQELFGTMPGAESEIQAICRDFIFGDVWQTGGLTPRQRQMIILNNVVIGKIHNELALHVNLGLGAIGLTPDEITEVVYQTAPFVGFSQTLVMIGEVNEAFKAKDIEIELSKKATITDENRVKEAQQLKKQLFGDGIESLKLPEPIARHVVEMCIGDFFTRKGLDLKTRAMLAFVSSAISGGSRELTSTFALANKNVGNDKSVLVDALVQSISYTGLPKVVGAALCLNEVYGE